jgi:hypothetical protein
MDYLDCSHQTLSRISFNLIDIYGRVLDLNDNHISFSIVFPEFKMERELFCGTYYIYKRMGRKAKTTAVPIEQQVESIPSGDDEAKTDAQRMTDIINEVNMPVNTSSDEDQKEAPLIEDLVDVPVAKAKAKRASRVKPAVVVEVVEPEVEVTASLDEVEAVITLPLPEELKVDTTVVCPDCGKQMSAKTLKYSHGPNCSAKKQKQGDEEFASTLRVAKQVVQEIGGEHEASTLYAFAMLEALNNVPEHVIEHHIRTRQRASRAVRRQEMVEKLMQHAF